MRIRAPLALSLAAITGACVPSPRTAPAPSPRAQPLPVLRPVPAPPPAVDWRDGPFSPGDWLYAGTAASFAGGAFQLRCERGAIQLVRRGSARAFIIRTTSEARTLPAQPLGDGSAAVLPANDRLLDAIGFSRGRFVVEAPPLQTLVVPAYAEILRVVEDCRG